MRPKKSDAKYWTETGDFNHALYECDMELCIIDLQADVARLQLRASRALLFEIDFGPHVRCTLKVTEGKIEVIDALDGWGNLIPSGQIVVLDLQKLLGRNSRENSQP